MDIWLIIITTLSTAALIKALFNFFIQSKKKPSLPLGPFNFPVIGSILWLGKPFSEIEAIIRTLHKKLGPIVTLRIGPRSNIFVADHSLAYQALVQKGAVFADRPPANATRRIATNNQLSINSSFYGPTWRLFRRNLTAKILYPSRVKSYSHARKWVLDILLSSFESQSKSGDFIDVIGNFQYAMFCLLVLMCFGEKLDQKQIEEIERVERSGIMNARKFDKLNFMPALTKIVFKKLWSKFLQFQKEREEVLIPLIRARKKVIEQRVISDSTKDDEFVLSYVDTLFDLELPDHEIRKLTEKEMVGLCNEFLNAGTDTTSTALQWIMANLVKYPYIQDKLFMEIKGVVANEENEVKEEDLQNMPYLKAIILEGLRRHPPAHFVLPHAVTEDVILDIYLVPKNANVNFMVVDMGWDPNVWEDPMAFKPERFMGIGEVFDITGSREIKMMPFGVGRRICPGYGLAVLHLEYFVANLVWNFEWKAVDGDEIDLSEKQELTIVMKNPFQARISPRFSRMNHLVGA